MFADEVLRDGFQRLAEERLHLHVDLICFLHSNNLTTFMAEDLVQRSEALLDTLDMNLLVGDVSFNGVKPVAK